MPRVSSWETPWQKLAKKYSSRCQVQSTSFNTGYPFPPYNFCSFLRTPFQFKKKKRVVKLKKIGNKYWFALSQNTNPFFLHVKSQQLLLCNKIFHLTLNDMFHFRAHVRKDKEMKGQLHKAAEDVTLFCTSVPLFREFNQIEDVHSDPPRPKAVCDCISFFSQ